MSVLEIQQQLYHLYAWTAVIAAHPFPGWALEAPQVHIGNPIGNPGNILGNQSENTGNPALIFVEVWTSLLPPL